MDRKQLTTIGLFVYGTILVTSFLHILDSFLAYSHDVALGPLTIPGWLGGVGVALGLDMAILYFSYLSVALRGQPGAATAKGAANAAMLLVWFAVLHSMVWDHVAAGRWLEVAVGFCLSLFVPLTAHRAGAGRDRPYAGRAALPAVCSAGQGGDPRARQPGGCSEG